MEATHAMDDIELVELVKATTTRSVNSSCIWRKIHKRLNSNNLDSTGVWSKIHELPVT